MERVGRDGLCRYAAVGRSAKRYLAVAYDGNYFEMEKIYFIFDVRIYSHCK